MSPPPQHPCTLPVLPVPLASRSRLRLPEPGGSGGDRGERIPPGAGLAAEWPSGTQSDPCSPLAPRAGKQVGGKPRKFPARTVAFQRGGSSPRRQISGAAGAAEKLQISTLQQSAEPEEEEKEAFTKHFAEEASPSSLCSASGETEAGDGETIGQRSPSREMQRGLRVPGQLGQGQC